LVWNEADHDKDDQLLHELVHALREMRGELNQIPTDDKAWDNEEEFFAILVTNIYLSELGKKYLQGNHHDMGLLSPALSTSEKFLGKGVSSLSRTQLENRRLVNKFVTENWGLCTNIKDKVDAKFNPIREYLRNTGAYPFDPSSVYAAG
jgi:hypothetical protein